MPIAQNSSGPDGRAACTETEGIRPVPPLRMHSQKPFPEPERTIYSPEQHNLNGFSSGLRDRAVHNSPGSVSHWPVTGDHGRHLLTFVSRGRAFEFGVELSQNNRALFSHQLLTSGHCIGKTTNRQAVADTAVRWL